VRRIALLVAVLAIGAGGWYWTESRYPPAVLPPLPVRGNGPVTVAATGDALLVRPLTAADAHVAARLVPLLGSADVALTNLETNLLLREHVPERGAGAPRRPYATADAADTLRRLGINLVSLANNHASDYDAHGLLDTRRILESYGVQHGGSGENLEAARAPVLVGTAPRRIAMIAVSTSASAESRAAGSWAGVNPLRFTVDVTVDSTTFDTLKHSAIVESSDRDMLMLHGTAIKRGARTVVNLVVDADDERQILEEIARARADADVVVVSLHAHEPRNDSAEPAAFVQRFARSAIDAGAAVVVGHGPHQLRGIELHGGGAILYSVGNFIFEDEGLDPRAMDVYDADVDLYGMAMGVLEARAPPNAPTFDEAVWWESVIARATFDHGGLTSLQLIPLDLGAGLPKGQRGVPRLASAERAARIVDRLSRLSAPFATRVVVADGVVRVDLTPAGSR
jgi:poly-gamma-glutamate capsule biosynthesis protein CapA/YwtB (metallophosphatase superfamily)